MSIPTSAIASTAAWFTRSPGSEPPDHAMARPPARWLNHPSAICDLPALCTHRNSTVGTASSPLCTAVLLDVPLGRDDDVVRDSGDIGIQRPDQHDRERSTDQLECHERRHRRWLDPGEG